jgi:hypothetical protein
MSDINTLLVPVREDDHVHQPAASLTLVEYGDDANA